MRVTTLAVFDIATGQLESWEGFDYEGAIENCGGIFAHLTKTAVQQPNGDTTYFNDPSQATSVASSQLPSADAMLGPDVLNPNPVAPAMPKISQPSFADANANGFTNPALTHKGAILSAVLAMLQGGAAGQAAVEQGSPRTGYPGLGTAALAGWNSPIVARQQRNELANDELSQDLRRAEIAAVPGQKAAQLAHLNAETASLNAQANRRENYTVPGVGLVTPDDTSPSGFKVVVPEPTKKGDLDTVAARQQYLDSVDPSGKVLDTRERMGFIATGKWPTETTDRAPSLLQWIAEANSSDPNVSASARKNLSSYRQVQADVHAAMRGPADESGLTPAQARLIKNDPQYMGLSRRYNALASEYAMQAGLSDPKNPNPMVASIGQQMDALTEAMEQRQASLLQSGTKGALRLKGATPRNVTGNTVGNSKQLDAATAKVYLQKAGGDKVRARQLAAADGWSF